MAESSEAPENGIPVPATQEAKIDENAQDDLEGAIEGDNPPANDSGPSAMNLDGANDTAADTQADKSLPTIETRIPAKKDASLREFLSKMDDYAPIVRLRLCIPIHHTFPSSLPLQEHARYTDFSIVTADPRRSNKLLPHRRRPAPAPADLAASSTPPRPRHAEVHRRCRRRRVPIQPHQIDEYDFE